MCGLFGVEVRLVSNSGSYGIVKYNDRYYFIDLGWLEERIYDTIYCIHIQYLTKENIVEIEE